MDAISRNINSGIVIEKVNLVRATLNEAFELKDNLTEDGLDYNKIIVDLSGCDYIDSTFFGALVYSYKKIKENDGRLILVISESSLAASFIYKEISSIFEVYPTIRDAIAQLKKGNEEVVSERY
jgi:anti-anti-sigma factor